VNTCIWREFSFDAAHRLAFLPASHKCHGLHGHTYVVRVTVMGEMRGPWLLDFSDLKSVWEQMCGSLLDHKFLNDIPGLEEPTAEVLADWIFRRMARALSSVTVASVEVRETPNSGAVVTA
jgi:6-pyruvoyltetrahydropterin/6-carboxytetrahydropterin synthase